LKYLLDTNVISELRKAGRAHPKVIAWAEATNSSDIGTSVVVLAEIRRGIELKRRKDDEQARVLDHWFDQIRAGFGDRILPIDEVIADKWARLSVPNPLPYIDGLLAATAIVRGLILVTRNIADVSNTGANLFDPFAN
jgi:predicted nucleic acid-binding protein